MQREDQGDKKVKDPLERIRQQINNLRVHLTSEINVSEGEELKNQLWDVMTLLSRAESELKHAQQIKQQQENENGKASCSVDR